MLIKIPDWSHVAMVLEENKTSSKAPVGEFNSSDLEVGGVVVYRDRAEVKRLIRVSVKKGENDVVVNQLPSVVDPKSLRLVVYISCSASPLTSQQGQVTGHKRWNLYESFKEQGVYPFTGLDSHTICSNTFFDHKHLFQPLKVIT